MFANISWPDTGELTRQITIRQWQDVPDGLTAALDQEFETWKICWAKVQPVTGVAYWAGKQIDQEVTHIFWIRYREGTRPHEITGQHVVEWQNRRYRVLRTTNANDAQVFTFIEAKELGLIS